MGILYFLVSTGLDVLPLGMEIKKHSDRNLKSWLGEPVYHTTLNPKP